MPEVTLTLQAASPENGGIWITAEVGLVLSVVSAVVDEHTNQALTDETDPIPLPLILSSIPRYEILEVGAESKLSTVLDTN